MSAPTVVRKRPSGGMLPADVLGDASRRLGIASLALGLVFLAYQVLGMLVVHIGWQPTTPTETTVNLLCVGLSTAVFLLSRGQRLPPAQLLYVGLGYEVLVAFNVSLIEMDYLRVDVGPLLFTSWVSTLIVMFPVLVPARPATTFAAALAAASTGPLAWALSSHAPALSPRQFVEVFSSSYISALLALAPAFVIHGLGRTLGKARELGSYHLKSRLGEGGMGEVWLAEHRLLARPAAVKLIRSDSSDSDGGVASTALQRFELEARATAALRCPNTVVLYDFGVTPDGTFFYVMELLDGLDLETLVSRFGAQPPSRVIHLLRQVCASLDEAHLRGFVHRDIKPANIYCTRMGNVHDFVKVLDFGLVKTCATPAFGPPSSGAAAAGLSDPNFVFGTPGYMAPEQLRGEKVDARTDLYALGCVGYFLLCGEVVFDYPNFAGCMSAHLALTPMTPSQRLGGRPHADLDAVIMLCLEKDPDRRPSSAQELDRLLAACDGANAWRSQEAREWWEAHLDLEPTRR